MGAAAGKPPGPHLDCRGRTPRRADALLGGTLGGVQASCCPLLRRRRRCVDSCPGVVQPRRASRLGVGKPPLRFAIRGYC